VRVSDDGAMPWPTRRPTVPPQVVGQLELTAGERVLSAVADRGGRWHVATDRAFHVGVDDGWQRIPWQRVDRASWDRDADLLAVIEVADFGQPQPRFDLDLAEPGRFLEVVRERVTASVLLSRHVSVTGSRGLKVVARRPPAGDGELDWSFWLDVGLDPADPLVREAAERGLSEARAELGL